MTFAAWLGSGCTEPIAGMIHPNQRPTVEFTHAPVGADPNNPDFYAYRVYWSGEDPDGRVVRYEFCIDPTATDTLWSRTVRSEELVFFRATEPENPNATVPRAKSFHILILRAVDDGGAYSAPKTRAFYNYTVAPSVVIRAPIPSGLLQASIVPSVFVRWEGIDPDGQFHTKPVYYRHKLFALDEPGNRFMLQDPDSLRRRDGPGGFADWDSSGSESTFVRLTNLTPSRQYLFAVVGYDEAGAYSPVFSLFENMLQMYVTLAASIGPRIHVFNSIIDFTYDSGGYTPDPLRWIRIEAGTGSSLTMNWDAIATTGSVIENYRWALDLKRLDDTTPRVDEDRDVTRWSRASPLTTTCTLPGLTAGQHFLYIEATDNNGLASLGVVEIQMVAPSFDHELLIVDDTRLEPDKLTRGRYDLYKKPWPSAAELDTFLYARGGVRWRETKEPTSGVFTIPGVFAGYRYDTLGTRLGYEIPSNGVRLARLAQYRNVVWMVDREAAQNIDVMGNMPMPVLRYMNTPGHASTLGGYMALGGRVWLCGGAAGTASMEGYNQGRNDDVFGHLYTRTQGELTSGRLMVDGAHWLSAFSASIAYIRVERSPRADQIAAAPWEWEDAWTHEKFRAPDYRRLPPELRYRDPATDPIPPTRYSTQGSLYYRSSITSEYMIEPNEVLEDVDLSGPVIRMDSVLDTLYDAHSILIRRSPSPTMTWYHGRMANRFVFSGFAPWDFRREDCVGLTDFVLHDLWGLDRAPVDRMFRASTAPRPAPPRDRNPGRAAAIAPVTPAGPRR